MRGTEASVALGGTVCVQPGFPVISGLYFSFTHEDADTIR
jgi:hypothetical protein